MTDFPIPDDGALVEERVGRILTQYRESPRLLHLIRTYLGQAEDLIRAISDMPLKFYLDDAVGDQLTLLGRRMGFDRQHCICQRQAVFGFDCPDVSHAPVSGFCNESVTWEGCNSAGAGVVNIASDDLYRKFLQVRAYQIARLFDMATLERCISLFWGDTAWVVSSGVGRVIIAPGRALTDQEVAVQQLYPRVLPVPPGVEIRFHFRGSSVFGFGEGWSGFCENDDEEYVIGVSDDVAPGVNADEGLSVGALRYNGEWTCAVDVHPYQCA